MGPISPYSGQQSVAPLTRQLREQGRAEVGGSDGDSDDGKKAAVRQQTAARVATPSMSGTESRNLALNSGTPNQNQPSSANSPRGSLLDMKV